MSTPDAFREHARPGRRLWWRKELEGDSRDWFEHGAAALSAAAAEGSQSVLGRRPACHLRIGAADGVWRHNRHGGFLGGVLADRYRSPQRLFAEVCLSEELRASGVSTPAVLLALAQREAGFWRQDLVTREVPRAITVFDAREDATAQQAAAALLEQLFELGLWASDLHPGNLLWQADERRCWLIDLAGARRFDRPLTRIEREQRLKRFVRFYRKHAGSVPATFR